MSIQPVDLEENVEEKITEESPTVILPPEAIERFLGNFERSTRRWEIVVYPAMFAFIVLAIYGFILIGSLTSDMHQIAASIDGPLNQNINSMSANIAQMRSEMVTMREQLQQMSGQMQSLDELAPMQQQMQQMNDNMQYMVVTTQRMQNDMAALSWNIARPMSWMPW